MKNYKVTVKGQSTFDLTEEQIAAMDSIQLQENQAHILQDSQAYTTEILENNFLNKSYTVKVNNSEYEVEIATELDGLIKELGFEVGASKQVNAIKAPMPGLILSIHVEVGQEVQENDSLLILEAMKMENNFNSPRAGKIKSILVEKGQAVDKGQLLIEFE
ncbi:acetyl-CoA carboxylase biotin carboxyl carrier protein subunit [Moheibacter stercoris]|uniref:Biotin carboxyl carrier protein n=1 Tax=Moheibacter stercoris TaxID=1628251 RepID=A0ABV2LRX3_9FLAO